MRKVLFDIEAFEEYNDWANKNIRLFNRIAKLIDECRRTPLVEQESLNH
jgi:Txe/YoeB family toxin of Txe-Axe toxin-antitoxin module